jgi:hypothetical protein
LSNLRNAPGGKCESARTGNVPVAFIYGTAFLNAVSRIQKCSLVSISRFRANIPPLIVINFNQPRRRAVLLLAKLSKLHGHLFYLLGSELGAAVMLFLLDGAFAAFGV